MRKIIASFLFVLSLGALSCTKGTQGMVITPPSTKPGTGGSTGGGSGSGSGGGGTTGSGGGSTDTGTLCTDIGQTPIVLAYFTEYTETLPDVTLLTHINYAHGRFGNPKTGDGGIVITESDKAPIKDVVALKSKNPKLKATYVWNFSFLATKSVSALTSTTTPVCLSSESFVKETPSAAILPAFFSAPARPCSLRKSTALSISPSVAARAFLQAIIPAPVMSRNSLT